MIKKQKIFLICILFLIIIFIQISFVFAEEIELEDCEEIGHYSVDIEDCPKNEVVEIPLKKDSKKPNGDYFIINHPKYESTTYGVCCKILDIGKMYLEQSPSTTFGKSIEYKKIEEYGKIEHRIILWRESNDNITLKIMNRAYENIVKNNENYISLDNEGNIIGASFHTNEKGGTYDIGKLTFPQRYYEVDVPPNSMLLFDGREIKVFSELNGEIKKIPKLIDDIKDKEWRGYKIKIEGDNTKLPNGKILKSGTLTFKDKKYIVEKGDEASFEDVKFLKTENDVTVCFEKKCKNEKENYFYSNDKEITIHSIKEGKVKTEFLPGNEFFDMKKREYDEENNQFVKFKRGDEKQGWKKDEYGYRYRDIADERSEFKVIVTEGDNLEIINREKQGLIPKVIHKSSENGMTAVENGRITFIMDKDRVYTTPPKPLSFDLNEKQNSVALQIESNSKSNLRISSSNRYIISEKDISRVAYNGEKSKVSELIKDNKLKTLDQLKAKYSDIFFFIPDNVNRGNYKYSPNELKEVNPHTIQLLDQWFDENPEAKKRYEEVVFTDEFNAGSGWKGGNLNVLYMGAKAFDVYGDRIRETTPYSILTHEDEHSMDHIIIGYKEPKKLEKIKLSNEAKKYQEEINNFKKEYMRNIGLASEGKIKQGELVNRNYEIKKRIVNVEEKLGHELNKNPETKRLQFFYNEIVYDKTINLLNNEKEKIDEIRKSALHKIAKIAKEKYDVSLDVDKIIKNLYDAPIFPSFKSELGGNLQEWPKGAYNLYQATYHLSGLDAKNIERTIKEFQKGEQDSDPTVHLSGAGYRLRKIEGFSNLADEVIKLPERYGFPANYGLHNYASRGKKFASRFAEMSSTYREEPINIRKQKANSENLNVRETYRKLTQLAFDSGKMKADEYKQIMGGDSCKRIDCCDKKCVMYKLTCVPC